MLARRPFVVAALLAISATTCVVAGRGDAAQLYLSPAPATASSTRAPLTAAQANAVLAHHLGASQYEHMPLENGDTAWQELLTPRLGDGPRVAVIVECPTSQACADIVPEQFDAQSGPVAELPSLPVHSWLSAVTLHLHRLTSALGIDKNSDAVYGVDSLAKALKSLDGWAGWVGDELGSRIGWDRLKDTVKAAVEPVLDDMGILTEANLLDKSANDLVFELQNLAKLADSLGQRTTDDDGPQSESARVIALHIKGLAKVASAHSPSSDMYHRAATLLRQTLSATMSAVQRTSTDEPTFVLLALPPYKQPWLAKRTNWLQPFQAPSASYVRVARPKLARSMTKKSKRSTVFSPRAAAAADRTPVPVVAQSRRCFTSEKELKNLTASCLGRGRAVKGITTRKLDDGAECWVCSCGTTRDDNGKVQKWAGEGCEKQDLSSDFVLLFFSGLGLVLILVASVVLLYGVGNVELPGTLSSVSGAGSGHKRD
ncbi:hypothetical protein OIV83_001094 [Microbotryomycetes sp. JL201]|nr:hypothetical protein OIV83_001094 [Microbotryomycetes sp. JL201]